MVSSDVIWLLSLLRLLNHYFDEKKIMSTDLRVNIKTLINIRVKINQNIRIVLIPQSSTLPLYFIYLKNCYISFFIIIIN